MRTGKILVLGATGGTGQQVVSQALEQGHDVTAFVRDPKGLTITHDHLRVLTGNIMDDGKALDAAIHGQEVVISALGVGNSFKSGGLIKHSVPAIVRAMEAQGVRRLIFTSAYGVGTTRDVVPVVPRMFMRLLLRDVYADKEAGDDHIHRSTLDWTIVYPVTLTNGTKTGRYRVGEQLALRGVPKIARADVAHFLVSQIEDGTYLRKGVLIGN